MKQPPGSTMGKEFYDEIIRPAFESVPAKFKHLMDEGRLKKADPWVALMHWKGLGDWDFFERRILGAISGPEDVGVERVATLAADAFLTLYGPEGQGSRTASKKAVPTKARG